MQRHLTAEKPCDMLVLPELWAGLLGDLTSTPTSAVDMALIVGHSLLSPENQLLQCFTLLRAHLKRGFAEMTIRRARSSPDSIGHRGTKPPKDRFNFTKVSAFHHVALPVAIPVALPVALSHGELSRHLLLWLSSKKNRKSHWLISLKSEKCADFLLQALMVFTMATFFGP